MPKPDPAVRWRTITGPNGRTVKIAVVRKPKSGTAPGDFGGPADGVHTKRKAKRS